MSKTDDVRVLLVVGSVRPDRRADVIVRWWLAATEDELQALGARVEVADLRSLALPLDDEPDEPASGSYRTASTRAWSAMVRRADAVVVVTGEHNHGLPAALKNAFDHLSSEWADKPVAWVCYGNTSAGTRALLGGKQLATTLGLVSVGPDVAVRLADLVDDEVPRDSRRDLAAQAAVTALARWARLLRTVRADELDVPDLPPGYDVHRASTSDAAELLVMQRACWVEEAVANDTLDVPALHESAESVVEAIEDREVVVVRRGGRLVASVQGWSDAGVWRIGRLMVAPDHRRRGIATALLRYAESGRPPRAEVVELSTGAASASNLALYRANGYEQIGDADGVVVSLRKRLPEAATASTAGDRPIGDGSHAAGV